MIRKKGVVRKEGDGHVTKVEGLSSVFTLGLLSVGFVGEYGRTIQGLWVSGRV